MCHDRNCCHFGLCREHDVCAPQAWRRSDRHNRSGDVASQRTAASKAREEMEDTAGYGASCDNMAAKCNLHGFSKASTEPKGPFGPFLPSNSDPNSLKTVECCGAYISRGSRCGPHGDFCAVTAPIMTQKQPPRLSDLLAVPARLPRIAGKCPSS